MSHPGATASDRHKVVIIGSGFGGLNSAQKLKRTDVDIKLIARTTHHLFQPLLYQVATGIISEGEIAPPTRLILRKQENAQVLLGDVTHVDLDKQDRHLGAARPRLHDAVRQLIIAAGAGQSYFGNDHFAEFAPGMKSIDDALELRGRILGAFEQAETVQRPGAPQEAADVRRRRRGSHRCRDGGSDPGAGRPDAQGQLPAHRPHRGARHPARRRAGGASAHGQEAGPQGAGAAGEDGRRGSAQRHGDRRRPQRHHRQGRRRHHPAHRGGLQGVVGRCVRPARWAATWPNSPRPRSTGPAG